MHGLFGWVLLLQFHQVLALGVVDLCVKSVFYKLPASLMMFSERWTILSGI